MKLFSLFLIVAFASVAFADAGSFTSMTSGVNTVSSTNAALPAETGTDALSYYSDVSVFEAAHPGLTVEDFSSTLVAAGAVGSDTGPLDYYTNNSLFALNTITDGISISEQSDDLMVVLGIGFIGVTSVTVGPNSFAGNARIDFTIPVDAFGVDIVTPNGAAQVDIELFGASGSLGTTTMTGGSASGVFWGVYCDSEDITYILFQDPADQGELFANARFGVTTALSRTTWAGIKTNF